MSLRVLAPVLAVLTSCSTLPVESPIVPGSKPRDHGAIGAGEGPAFKDGKLYFTDGKGINRMDLASGRASVFRRNCGSPNGLMFDWQGRMIRCETSGRRVVREDADGGITELASRFEGHRFNSPNDLAADSKGRIYFTDPRYGSRDTMEMRDKKGRLVEGVYRIDNAQFHSSIHKPGQGEVRVQHRLEPGKVSRILGPDEVERPNGILVSPDDKYLYVADNNNNNHGGSRKLLRFTLNKDGFVKPLSRKVIFDWKDGRGPDGVKMDAAGRLYVAAGVNKPNDYETSEFKAGCYILSSTGKLIDFVPTSPDEATNCALGDPGERTLFITSGGHLWSVPLKLR